MSILDHQHLIVNAIIKNPPKENDENLIIDWFKRLVKAINMKIVIGPHAHYCKADENEGITGSVNIETSHCAIHIWDKLAPPLLRFDCYSCANFSIDTIIKHIKEFEPYCYDYVLLDRNNALKVIEKKKVQVVNILDMFTNDERTLYYEAKAKKSIQRTELEKQIIQKYKFNKKYYSY